MMKKLWILLLLVMLSMSMIVMSASAETVLKDGIEVMLTTDKESYDSLDIIDAKLTVKNTNSFDVENVSMEIKAPEGYMLTSDGETKIGELSAGETQQQQTGMRDTEAPVPVLPKTGDNSHGMLWGLLFVLSSAAVCVLVIRYPQAKRIISLLLCVALVAPYMLEVAPVLAENLGNGELEDTITVTKKVTVDGELVEISGSVRYNASSIISGNTKVKVSLLTLDEQSEGTSWFTTSQINTSANKPFTIEWNSIEGVTSYSFTILNEKREPAFSNQKTWFAGESTNSRTLILTGPGVYYLRSYAFTKETEDAGFRGDYTNAPYSEIKIIVSEESTSDFVLSASEENKKILFSTDYQESEVKLYQSGQISVAHSEITNGVLLMDEYNVMEGDPFQYLYQPLRSNKSYVFCAVANDGSVSNAILVAGADVCEELPTVNGVVMSRNSLQKGDTISINGGIVSGNDLRIYDIKAYLQKEDSGEKIWPAVWWYYYVWGQHGDLSSFELNSFEEFTLISDEEPGRYRFYVDVECYGNVLVTLPTSVFVDVQISAEDCDHSSGNHNTTKNSDSVTRYRLNPEDESSHPNGHQTGDIYTRYCADCGSFLAGDILIWSNALQSHQMVDGACSLCGYIAEETECQHTEYTDVYNPNIEIKYTDNKDGKTHIWQNGYDRICNACQVKFDVVYGVENTADHDYTNGDVCLCGYDRSNCQHTPGEVKIYNRHIFAPFDEKQHQTTAIIWDVVCSSCGLTYEMTDTEGDENNPVGLKYDHVWDETGKCETQGCEYRCVHTFEDIMLPDGNHKAENGIWESKGESGHWCTSIEWWEKCTNCGLEQKYTQNDPYNGDEQEHRMNMLISTGYNYNETEHWIVGRKMRCTALGCGCEKFVEVDNAVHAPHQFSGGYCTVCGRATPYYSGESSESTSNADELSKDAQTLLNNLKKYENQLPKESFYYFDELHYDKFIGAYLEDELTQQIWDEGGVEGKLIAIGGAAYVLGMNTQAGLQGALAGVSGAITGAVSGVVDLVTQSGMTEEEKKQKKTADEILAILKDKSEEIKNAEHEAVSISETANDHGNALIGWAKLLVGTFEQGFSFKDTEVLEAVHEALKGSKNIGNTSKVSSLYNFYSGIKVKLRGTEIPLTEIFGFTTEADAEAGKAFKNMMQRIKKTDDLGKLTTEMGKIQDSYNGKKWNLDALGGGSGKFEFDKFGMTADTVLGFINLYVETQSMNMIYDDWYGAIESKLNELDPESEAYKAIEEVLNSIYKYDGNLELGEIGSLVLEGGQIVGNAAVATAISGGIKAVSFPATIVVEGALLASAIGNVDEKASALFDLPDYIDDYRFKREEYVKAINNYMQNPTNDGYFDVVEKANDLYWATELADNCALRYQRAVDDTLWINNGNFEVFQKIPEYEKYQSRINTELKQTRDYFEKLGIGVTSINAL